MDKLSEQLHRYLQLAHSSALLVTRADRDNLEMLFALLKPLDRDLLESAYGLFGTPPSTYEDIAARYRVKPDVVEQWVTSSLRLIAISPEWQMLLRQLKPIVKHRIGVS